MKTIPILLLLVLTLCGCSTPKRHAVIPLPPPLPGRKLAVIKPTPGMLAAGAAARAKFNKAHLKKLAVARAGIVTAAVAPPTIDFQVEYFDSQQGWVWITGYTFNDAGQRATARYTITDFGSWQQLADFGIVENPPISFMSYSPGPSSGFPQYFIEAVEVAP